MSLDSISLDSIPRLGLRRSEEGGPFSPGVLPTGFASLDRYLPGAGWPLGALTEILTRRNGIGELALLMPALRVVTGSGRWTLWIAPPHLPFAPALEAHGVAPGRVLWLAPPGRQTAAARDLGGRPEGRMGKAEVSSPSAGDYLWAAEQALRSAACGAVLLWSECLGLHLGDKALRRLQLAAEASRSWAVLFRAARWQRLPSPAALRLLVQGAAPGTSEAPDRVGSRISILKCRGRMPPAGAILL